MRWNKMSLFCNIDLLFQSVISTLNDLLFQLGDHKSLYCPLLLQHLLRLPDRLEDCNLIIVIVNRCIRISTRNIQDKVIVPKGPNFGICTPPKFSPQLLLLPDYP